MLKMRICRSSIWYILTFFFMVQMALLFFSDQFQSEQFQTKEPKWTDINQLINWNGKPCLGEGPCVKNNSLALLIFQLILCTHGAYSWITAFNQPITELSWVTQGPNRGPRLTFSPRASTWVNQAPLQTVEVLSPPVPWPSPDSSPSRSTPFYPSSPLWMQRCDWTLAACQEERDAVLRPKSQTQAGPWRLWSTSVEGKYTVLDPLKVFLTRWALAELRPSLRAPAVEAAAVLFSPPTVCRCLLVTVIQTCCY